MRGHRPVQPSFVSLINVEALIARIGQACDTVIWYYSFWPEQMERLKERCPQVRLVIELDGSQHYTEKEEAYDRKRTVFLESYHIQVIRFYNGKINLHFKEVCMEIEKVIAERIKQMGTDF